MMWVTTSEKDAVVLQTGAPSPGTRNSILAIWCFLPLALATILVQGCGCSNGGLMGDADVAIDEPEEVLPEVVRDPVVDDSVFDIPDVEEVAPDPEEEDIEEEPLPACGDGSLDTGEECDDGDLLDCNGCSSVCEWERAFDHDGTTSGAVVDLSVAPCLPEEFTIEMWFKLDVRMVDTGCYLIYQPGTIHLILGTFDGDSTVSTEICSPGGSCLGTRGLLEYPLDERVWHHWAITFGYDEIEGFYRFCHFIDGNWVFSPGGWSSPGIRPCDAGWYIVSTGSEPASAGPCFLSVDEVRISNGVLYSSTFTPTSRLSVAPETIAFWDFNEEIGGVVRDETGHGHDAVILDGTLEPDECHSP